MPEDPWLGFDFNCLRRSNRHVIIKQTAGNVIDTIQNSHSDSLSCSRRNVYECLLRQSPQHQPILYLYFIRPKDSKKRHGSTSDPWGTPPDSKFVNLGYDIQYCSIAVV